MCNAGTIRFENRQLFIANALRQHNIGLEEVDDGRWSIYFCNVLMALCLRISQSGDRGPQIGNKMTNCAMSPRFAIPVATPMRAPANGSRGARKPRRTRLMRPRVCDTGVVALMRKLAKGLWACVRSGQPFDTLRLQAA